MQGVGHQRRSRGLRALLRVPMDLRHLGVVGERLAVAGHAGPVGVGDRRIAEDYLDQVSGLTDGDSLPDFVAPELREGEPVRHLHSVLVLRGNGPAAQRCEQSDCDRARDKRVHHRCSATACAPWKELKRTDRGCPAAQPCRSKCRLKSWSGSVQALTGRQPEAPARAWNSLTVYLCEFSVWMRSPSAKAKVRPSTRTVCRARLTRYINAALRLVINGVVGEVSEVEIAIELAVDASEQVE